MERTVIKAPSTNESAMAELLDNMYITNVEKRLRDLNNPSEIDKKRWVWELIQNAKDTIAKDTISRGINIRIEISGDIVKFKHDGNPFTAKSRLGLLYKYSEEKEGQESTGRFGTGFLTTHCLSKIVTVESNMFSDEEQTKLCGFKVTMFRDGLIKSDLIDGLKKMRESEEFYAQTFDWTTFTYHVNSDAGRDAIRSGIENYHENIAQTMLFCKEINSIELNDNGNVITILRKPETKLTDDITLAEYEFKFKGETMGTRRFLYTHYEADNSFLSARYRTNRKIRLDVALEINGDNNLVNHKGKTSFFCVLPLVGIENQLSEPIYINSPDFEPDSERQSLLLNGQVWNEEKNVITETGINRLIYSEVFPLYEKMVSYISSEKKYGRLFYLANGLDRPKSHEKLDKEWYQAYVIQKYRDILLKYPIVDAYDGSGLKKLSDCIIVSETKEEDESTIFSLLKYLYPTKLVLNNHEWATTLWKSGLNIYNTEEICKNVENVGSWNNLDLENITLDAWYNQFLGYVSSYDERLLKEYALLPDMNGLLQKKDKEDFKQGEGVTAFIINLLFRLGKDIKPILLHDRITTVSLDRKYNSQSFSADINKLAKTIIDDSTIVNKEVELLPLLSVIPTDVEKYGQNFISQRASFYGINVTLHQIPSPEPVYDNSLLDSAWKELDVWFVGHVLQKINDLSHLDNLPKGLDAKWLNNAIKALNVTTDRLNTHKVLPNQNGIFCAQKELYEDDGVPEVLKDDIFDSIGLNYKKVLLHKDMDASCFSVVQKKNIATFATEIKDKYAKVTYGFYCRGYSYNYKQEILDNVAKYMVSILPSDENTELYCQQRKIYKVATEILGESLLFPQSIISYNNVDLWSDSNVFLANQIAEKITSFETLEMMNQKMNFCGEKQIMDCLNDFYSFIFHNNIPYSSFVIYPNQNGNFRDFNSLKKEDGNIDDIIKDVVCQLMPAEEEYRNILIDKRCFLQPNVAISSENAYKLIDDRVLEYYNNSSKWDDDGFINAVHLLIEVWKGQSGQFTDKNFRRNGQNLGWNLCNMCNN